jgi:hypothetical protein
LGIGIWILFCLAFWVGGTLFLTRDIVKTGQDIPFFKVNNGIDVVFTTPATLTARGTEYYLLLGDSGDKIEGDFTQLGDAWSYTTPLKTVHSSSFSKEKGRIVEIHIMSDEDTTVILRHTAVDKMGYWLINLGGAILLCIVGLVGLWRKLNTKAIEEHNASL